MRKAKREHSCCASGDEGGNGEKRLVEEENERGKQKQEGEMRIGKWYRRMGDSVRQKREDAKKRRDGVKKRCEREERMHPRRRGAWHGTTGEMKGAHAVVNRRRDNPFTSNSSCGSANCQVQAAGKDAEIGFCCFASRGVRVVLVEAQRCTRAVVCASNRLTTHHVSSQRHVRVTGGALASVSRHLVFASSTRRTV